MLDNPAPTLYIVMRKDLYDNNPGKMMAQAAHAQAEFDNYSEDTYTEHDFRSAHLEWCESRNFGTTVVLSATLAEIQWINSNVEHGGLVEDPTYPFRDYYGNVHTNSEITCSWVFAVDQEDSLLMKKFDLHC